MLTEKVRYADTRCLRQRIVRSGIEGARKRRWNPGAERANPIVGKSDVLTDNARCDALECPEHEASNLAERAFGRPD